MFDYHHHSESSVDSVTPMADVCRAAIAKGVTEIAFTEHMDFIPEERNTGYFDYGDYMRHIEATRAEFDGRIVVLAGVEIDYCPDFEDDIASWLDGKAFDFVVGSVHYVRGEGNISEPRAMDFFKDRTVDEAYSLYLDLVQRSANTGMWDTLGHLDLIKRYGVKKWGPFKPERFQQQIDDILTTVIDRGMALEINTSGLRQSPEDFYPTADVVRRYRELGGSRLTVGSDSHNDRHVGLGIPEAYQLALDVGFHTVEQFRERRSLAVPIQELMAA